MKRSIRVIIFFMIYTLEVRVKAEVIENSPDVVSWPKTCYSQNQTPCAIKSIKNKVHLNHLNSSLFLESGGIVVLQAAGLTFVKGTLLVESQQPIKIHHAYSNAIVKGRSLLKASLGGLYVAGISGESLIFTRGNKKSLKVPAGYQFHIEAVDTNGKSHFDFPQAADFKSVTQYWAKLSPVSKSEFKERARSFWKATLAAANYLAFRYEDMAKRKIASHKEKIHHRKKYLQRQQEEEQKLKALFREKNYM